jgi:hypothetical protein
MTDIEQVLAHRKWVMQYKWWRYRVEKMHARRRMRGEWRWLYELV